MAIDKVAFQFKPFHEVDVPESKRPQAAKQIADYVRDEALRHIAQGKSPVQDGNWKRDLESKYKKKKSKISGVTFSNLELEGEMLDAFEVVIDGDILVAQIEGDQAGKADGNNRGTYGKSRGSKAKAREFIPKSGQTWNETIWSGINRILDEYKDEDGE